LPMRVQQLVRHAIRIPDCYSTCRSFTGIRQTPMRDALD
jgi:hypothetical protein